MKRFWVILEWFLYAVLVGWLHFRGDWQWWGLGILLALLLLLLDRCLYVWWLKPFEQLSIQIQYWWKRRDLATVTRLFWERGNEQTRLVLTSLGFALIWPLLAIYVLTSTGSVTAIGLVMGLGLHICLFLLQHFGNIRSLETRFCWQIKRLFSDRELRVITGVFVGVFVLVNALLLVR